MTETSIAILALQLLPKFQCTWIANNLRPHLTASQIFDLMRQTKPDLAPTYGEWQQTLDQAAQVIASREQLGERIITLFDPAFPSVPDAVPPSLRPVSLFYRGDVALLQRPYHRIAVIGSRAVSERTLEREREIVHSLVSRGLVIVSGLALGCDGAAHAQALSSMGKTIAIMPSTLDAITPQCHIQLARDIESYGGLLISEYFRPAPSPDHMRRRFIHRDRLQAILSGAVLLIAGDEDSGSRHAIETAKKYGVPRAAMTAETPSEKGFGLNRSLLMPGSNVIPVSSASAIHLDPLINATQSCHHPQQMTLDL